MKGYVYAFAGSVDELERIARKHLGDKVWRWTADPAYLKVESGHPSDWKDQGTVFNERGELRWHREEGDYRALLLTEVPVEDQTPLPGEWTAEKQTLFLQDLEEPKVHPQFGVYPTGKSKGRIIAHLYCRDGMPLFLSLRKFEEG